MGLRVSRRLAAAAVSVGLVGGFATIAHADVVNPDGDTAAPGDSPAVFSVANGNCASSITGAIRVSYNGNDHFTPGEAVNVVLTPPAGSGITATATATNIPLGWGDTVTEATIPISTSISTTTADSLGGPYQVEVTSVKGSVSNYEPTGKPKYSVSVSCAPAGPVNTAPTVAFINAATEVNEGATVTFHFSITDPDSTDTHQFAVGYPDCGAGNTLGATSIDDATDTGSFNCTFPDGRVPAVTSRVKLEINDGYADSAEATTDVQVDNVNPAVDAPTFAVTTVNCQTTVTLDGISFTDPGADANWTVDINWGDGSTHTSYSTAIKDSQPSQSHLYAAPGTYTATVTVTDKDTGQGSNTSSNSLVVKQVYNTDFLPPFDDSKPSGLIVNTMKNGRVVPVKVTLYDVCAQGYVMAPAAVTIQVSKTSGTASIPADPVEAYADAGSSSGGTDAFRWTTDATVPGGGFWIYNLDSKALGLVTNNFYRVDAYVNGVKATMTDWGVLQPVK